MGSAQLIGVRLDGADVRGASIKDENLVRVDVTGCRNLKDLIIISSHTRRPVTPVRLPPNAGGLEWRNMRALLKAHGLTPE